MKPTFSTLIATLFLFSSIQLMECGHTQHHDHDHRHSRDYDESPITPEAIHEARVTEVTDDAQWGGPPVSSDYSENKGGGGGGKLENSKNRPNYYPGLSTSTGSPVYPVNDRRTEDQLLQGKRKIQKFGFPPHCVDAYDRDDISIEKTTCQYMVVITPKPQAKGPHPGYLNFKVSRRMQKPYGYVAVGLSKDEKMDDDHIVECVKTRDNVHPMIYHSWSNYHSRPNRLTDDSSLILNKQENFDTQTNILTCEFDRPLVSTVHYQKGDDLDFQVFDMLRDNYKILMAVGETTKPDSDILGFHGSQRTGSVSIFEYDHAFAKASSSVNLSWMMALASTTILLTLKIFELSV